MKHTLFSVIILISCFHVYAENKISLSSLNPEIRKTMYPAVNARDAHTDSKVSPIWGFTCLQKNLQQMTANSKVYRQLLYGKDPAKNYLDYVFSCLDYDLFKEYIIEIETACSVMEKTAPKKEILNVKKVFSENTETSQYNSFDTMIFTYIEREISEFSDVKEGDTSFDESIKYVRILGKFSTWQEFFLNNKKDQVLPVLKKLYIREWLTYLVEYELPQKDIPTYKSKLKVFLKKWGL